ncbi:MAG: PspC domain-containing protein [Spirochaetales bacterium]|nr:PspC domain-containing protein [Spirochaetales bacterium]
MAEKKLYLSEEDKKIAGVCGGLAEYLKVDSTLIRVLWVIAAIIFGSGVLAYLIAWLLMPRRPEFRDQD